MEFYIKSIALIWHIKAISRNMSTTLPSQETCVSRYVFFCQFGIENAHFVAPFNLSYGFLFASALSAFYLVNGFVKRIPLWGVFTTISIFLLWGVACLWYHAFGKPGSPWYQPTGSYYTNPLVLMYTSSLIESLSHIIVPQLPPYIVGVNHWYDTLKFFTQGLSHKLYIFLSMISGFTFSPLVSYISWPHLIGDMTIYQLLSLGYHPKFYQQYARIAIKAELTGNPAMDKIPKQFKDLIHGMPGNSGTPRVGPNLARFFS